MLAFLSLTGILLSIILLFFNFRNNRSSIYLALFFFSISIYSFIHYVLFFSKSTTLIALFFAANIGFLTYLAGPMLFFYTRSITTDRSKLKLYDLFHFIPIILLFILGMPQYFSSWQVKLQFASEYINNNKALISFYEKSPQNSISFLLIFFSRPIYIFIYFAWSVVLFLKHKSNRKNALVFNHQKFMYSWLSVLFIIFLILIVSHTSLLYLYYFSDQPFLSTSFNIIQLTSLIGLMGLLFTPFLFPSILYGLPQFQTVRVSNNKEDPSREIEINPTTTIKNEKEEALNVSVEYELDYLAFIDKVTEECMSTMQPYIQPDCNLAYFAKIVKIPAHHLAYYYKEVKKQPFNDYRNSWRIKHAKELIKQGKTSEFTIEAIGLLSGFSSKSAFFVAFKKEEGVTPGYYAEKVNS